MSDDRSTKARIRDAAIACFAEHGVADTTARRVATAAGVSAGLVMHHFGSMEGLREACDERVATAIRGMKHDAVSTGPQLDVLGTLRSSAVGPLMGYLARVLTDDSPAVAALVDDLVADAEGYMKEGIDSGMLKPTDDLRRQAAVLITWSLGALVLHQHVDRLLGVDLTDPALGDGPAIASYALPAYEILSQGIFTEAFGAHLQQAFGELADDTTTTEPGPIGAPSRTTKGPR